MEINGRSTISGIHSILPLPNGGITSQVINATTVGSANSFYNSDQIYYSPFIPNQTFTTSNLYIIVVNAVVNGLVKIGIYSNLVNSPNELIFTSSDIDCSTTGIKTILTSFTFVSGTIYWLSYMTNKYPVNLVAIPVAAVMSINAQTAKSSSNTATMLASNYSPGTYTNGLPNTASIGGFLSVLVPLITITKE